MRIIRILLLVMTTAYVAADVSSPAVLGIFNLDSSVDISRAGLRRSADSVAAPVAAPVKSVPVVRIELPRRLRRVDLDHRHAGQPPSRRTFDRTDSPPTPGDG
jgi:hypothetical protein